MFLPRSSYFLLFLLSLCFLSLMSSCGKENDEDKDAREEQQIEQGYYEASLIPLNVAAAGSPTGQLEIEIVGDDVDVKLKMNNTPSGIIHRQFIHTGGTCPPSTTDYNSDGHVDIAEAINVTGPVLIPLDNDLRGQYQGGKYPVAGRSGDYKYVESTSLVQMMADLGSPDQRPEDIFVKMDPDEPLNLTGRVIMVYGVHSGQDLPPTIASAQGEPAHRMLPIACGIIKRIALAPPVVYGHYPAPVPNTVPTRVPAPVPPPTYSDPEIIVQNSCSSTVQRNIIISGRKCAGGETVTTHWRSRPGVYNCNKDQWIIKIINPNPCTKDVCGDESPEQMFVANIRLARVQSPQDVAYYYIRPVSPLSNENWKVLSRHWIRSELRGEATVILRH